MVVGVISTARNRGNLCLIMGPVWFRVMLCLRLLTAFLPRNYRVNYMSSGCVIVVWRKNLHRPPPLGGGRQSAQMDNTNLQRGQRVRVHVRGNAKTAIVLKVPPWTETIAGTQIQHEDKALVQYPGTSIDGGNLFADISEAIPLQDIEVP